MFFLFYLIILLLIQVMEDYLQARQIKPHLSKKQSSGTGTSTTENNEVYYENYRKLYELSLILSQHHEANHHRRAQIMQKIKQLNDRIDDLRDPIRKAAPEKKRKTRRAADELEKQFTCEVQTCLREYATLTSLKIHQKLKHPHLCTRQKRSMEQSE